MADEKPKVRWQDLSGQERYRVLELMRRGEVEIKELCRSFGVSRQTLHRAREAADRAAIEALTRKRPGRQRPPASEQQVRDLERENRRLEKDLYRMGQRYEIAQTLLDLQRAAEEKKTPRTATAGDLDSPAPGRPPGRMATTDGSGGAGDQPGGAAPQGTETRDDAAD